MEASASGAITHPGFLEQYAATHRFRLGRPASVTMTPDGGTILFLRSGSRSFVRDLYAFDVEKREERVLLTAEQILGGEQEHLTPEELARRERQRSSDRGIASYQLSPDGRTILVPLSGRLYLVDRESGAVRTLTSAGGPPIDPRFSPDGSAIAVVRNGDLYVHHLASNEERRLTTRSSPHVSYGLAEFVAQEEMGRHSGFWWSPDGRWIAVQETDVSELERMHIAELVHPERAAAVWPYPRAGKKNAVVRLGVVSINGGDPRWVSWDRERHPYLATVRWDRGGPLTLVVQNRAQSEVAILAADTATLDVKLLHREEDSAWINLDQDMPRWLGEELGFLWTTERNGAWQLELRSPSGELIRPLCEPSFGYAGLISVDLRNQQLYVRATTEPTELHLWRLPLDASRDSAERLSDERGVHAAVFGRGHELFVHSLHTLEGRWDTLVRRKNELVGELHSVAEAPPFVPKLELRRIGPGFASVVVRPRDYDPGKKYPVLVYVYGGPHAQTVLAAPYDYLMQQWIADQGFVVVAMDGRGTPNRGRAFERAIQGSFVEVPLADQAAGLEALLASDPSLDRSRVGIYGWSFGGYLSAMAVLRRPDLFQAAVAGAPVTDWLDYDTHYTERYLGDPNERPESYTKSSALTYAAELCRPLLIIHGTSDDNVYFSHAVKLSDALFRAGKHHEFLPLAGFTHMVPEPLVTRRLYETIVGFFSRTLAAKD